MKQFQGEAEMTPMTLTPTPLQKVGGYDLAGEDPKMYDGMDMSTPREWKDIPLPTRAATTADPKPGPAPKPPQADPATIEGLQEVHDAAAKILGTMGRDACKHLDESKIENLLARIVSGDRRCKLCEKSYHSTQKLKNHMRKRHLGKTPYQCGECQRFYGDSQSLKIHMKKHTPEGEKAEEFSCKDCPKSFPTVGKLNQHAEKHQDIRCQYCGKAFAYMRTMKAHAAESCPNRPGKPTGATGGDPAKDPKASTSKDDDDDAPAGLRWRCFKCAAHYGARRNLKKHLNSKHGRVEIPVDYKPS